MRNEKEKLFSRYLVPKKKLRLRLFASHIKFIFLCASFPDYKALFIVICGNWWEILGDFWVIPRRWSTTSLAEFTCALLISSLFILLLWSVKAAISMANHFVEISLLLLFNIFQFFAHKSLVRPHWNDKRLCIHQVYISMELFNFPFDVVVVSPLIIIRSR